MTTAVRFERQGDRYAVRFGYDATLVALIKAVPSAYRSWKPDTKQWFVDSWYATDLAASMRECGYLVTGLNDPPPRQRAGADTSWARIMFARVGHQRAEPVFKDADPRPAPRHPDRRHPVAARVERCPRPNHPRELMTARRHTHQLPPRQPGTADPTRGNPPQRGTTTMIVTSTDESFPCGDCTYDDDDRCTICGWGPTIPIGPTHISCGSDGPLTDWLRENLPDAVITVRP